jgi:orotate phosphoribosyltransferase
MTFLASADIAEQVACYLLDLEAVKLRPNEPFTWASGWKSPIYCDNRVTLSFPSVRTYIKEALFDVYEEFFANATAIAGVATAGIPMAALLADEASRGMLYVRSAPKGHGMENLIEGKLNATDLVLVIEDLVSTGGSSLKAVDAIRAKGANVLGMISVFNYGFLATENAFEAAGVALFSLTDYSTLVKVALDKKLIADEDLVLLNNWRENPAIWGQQVLQD